MTAIALSARSPFSLAAVAGSHGWVRLPPFETDDHRAGFSYIARLSSGRVVELVVRDDPVGVLVKAPRGLSRVEKGEIRAMVTWMLGLDQDFSDFYEIARRVPKLQHVEQRAQGRLLRSPTLFEDAVKTILTTNTTWTGTIRMVRNLVAGYGSPLPGDADRHAFPTPEQLAGLELETLNAIAPMGYRTPYILELAQNIANGKLDLEAFKETSWPIPDLRKRLLGIKGVGDYAAAHLLMLLGRYDSIPVDSWARKMVSHEWHGGKSIGRTEVEEAFRSWGAWRGLAYWFWDWDYRSG